MRRHLFTMKYRVHCLHLTVVESEWVIRQMLALIFTVVNWRVLRIFLKRNFAIQHLWSRLKLKMTWASQVKEWISTKSSFILKYESNLFLCVFFLVPFKLVLTSTKIDKKPIFVNTPTQIRKISNYAHIGSHLASAIAYDPIDNRLIRNYAILYSSFDDAASSQVRIDKETGFGFVFLS